MPRYRLTIAYDGTDFFGWQKQYIPHADASPGDTLDRNNHQLFYDPPSTNHQDPTAEQHITASRPQLRTVALIIERALFDILREPVKLLGASRTDSGVHANAQTAAFTTPDDRRGPADDRLAMALNSRLPDDVLIRDCQPVPTTFDPITDCIAKGYRYSIHTGIERPLWNRRYVAHIREPLDHHAMADAARALVGEHDFAAFAAAGHGRESTVRTIHDCAVTTTPDNPGQIDINVSGNGFLYNMVRIIAGTLIDVGKSKRTTEDIANALATGNRRLAGTTMPPTGLRLMWIRYPEPIALIH